MKFTSSLKKTTSIFMLVVFVSNVLLPSYSWALTAGPTAPEATSFEPVDASDMVNLSSGDFGYNIPLLEIPGPSGGYPLSLSYHAGIMPGEEASWAGLGWSLNPGAITRSVNGFADDFKDVQSQERVYWEGGRTDTYTLGVTIGLNGLAHVSAGLQVSKDTYKNYLGWGGYVGGGIGIGGEESPLSINGTIGIQPYGGTYAGVGVGLTSNDKAIGATVGIQTNFESISYSARATFHNLGASINFSRNNGISASMSVGGVGGRISNGNRGRITTHTVDYTLPIWIFNIGFERTRYWMDQTENAYTSGALYNNAASVTNFDRRAYDSYTVSENINTEDPNKNLGATFLNYDVYNVNAQGLGGIIRPYSFKNLAIRQNKRYVNEDDEYVYEIKQYPYQADNYVQGKMEFRFVGDFSNSYTSSGETWGSANVPLNAEFGVHQAGLMVNNKLPGSKDIDWFTNQEIIDGNAIGLIETQAAGFVREANSKIGGFKITNESGVTYHFSLPAYAYDEYDYSENIKKPNGDYYTEYKKPAKYAYTWFLTAVTGPDFVDRGGVNDSPNSLLDENDWGYWVSFDYGKWTENYAWRNPELDYHQDLDNNFKNYSSGKKEIYYLDAISTRTHFALFVKGARKDAKSSGYAYNLQKKSNYGFIPVSYSGSSTRTYSVGDYCGVDLLPISKRETTTVSHITKPISSLQLQSIFLFEKAEFNKALPSGYQTLSAIRGLGGVSNEQVNISKEIFTKTFGYQNTCFGANPCNDLENCVSNTESSQTVNETSVIKLHNSEYVIDESDISEIATALNICKRKIDLVKSNKLVPETLNSFDHPSLYASNPPLSPSAYQLDGKLTLDEIRFFGAGGVESLPAISFFYDLEKPLIGVGQLSVSGQSIVLLQQSSQLLVGDIIKFQSNGLSCYALVGSITGASHTLKILGKNNPVSSTISWATTKNPPFKSKHFDMWNNYKPDYDATQPEDLSRVTTPTSSKSADVWSLRRIKTTNGAIIKINYEPDTYLKSVFQRDHSFVVKSLSKVSCESNGEIEGHPREPDDYREPNNTNGPPETINCIYRFNIYNEGHDLRDLFQTGQAIQGILPYRYYYVDGTISRTVEAYTSSFILQSVDFDFITARVSIPATAQLFGATIFYDFSNNAKNYEFTGGHRVKSIEVTDAMRNITSKTSYDYDELNGKSSGVISFEPDVFDKISFPKLDDKMEKIARDAVRAFSLEDMMIFARELPGGDVMYKYVSVSGSTIKDGYETIKKEKILYEFETINKGMVGLTTTSSNSGSGTYNGTAYDAIRKRQITLRDLVSNVGLLKSTSLLDVNNKKINETRYEYLYDRIANAETLGNSALVTEYELNLSHYNNQGLFHEVIWDARYVKQPDNKFDLFGIISKRQSYPVVLLATTTFDYKMGLNSTQENLAFDFYSGQATKSLTKDGYGNYYLSELTPAYTVYSGMGLASTGGRNMLVQEAASNTFKVLNDVDYTPVGLVSASVETWSNQLPILGIGSNGDNGTQNSIWRKNANFSFIGSENMTLLPDGLIPISDFTGFNEWLTDTEPAKWQRSSKVELMDTYSHVLEASDVNGLYAATLMSQDQTRVSATCANCRYDEIGYSGAEEAPIPSSFASLLKIGSNTYCYTEGAEWSQNQAHTGTSSLSTPAGNTGFIFYTGSQHNTYQVSVWSTQSDATIKYQLDGGNIQLANTRNAGTAGNWHLLEATISNVSGYDNLKVWCEAGSAFTNFDDFRIHPLKSAMLSYVYNEWGELSHILDANNLFTEYRYDRMGRLKETYRESFQSAFGNNGTVKVGEYSINYASTTAHMLQLNVSKTGPTGTVSPSGQVSVALGGNQLVNLYEYCQNQPVLQDIIVDGRSYGTAATAVTIPSGTVLRILKSNVGGEIYTSISLENVQGLHNVSAKFGSPQLGSGQGTYVCETINGCYTGTIFYIGVDECGRSLPPQVAAPGSGGRTCTNPPESNCFEY